MKLGECLEAYRKEKNLTWRGLAKEIGVDHALLFRLRTETNSGTDTALKILTWLLSQSKKQMNDDLTQNTEEKILKKLKSMNHVF